MLKNLRCLRAADTGEASAPHTETAPPAPPAPETPAAAPAAAPPPVATTVIDGDRTERNVQLEKELAEERAAHAATKAQIKPAPATAPDPDPEPAKKKAGGDYHFRAWRRR